MENQWGLQGQWPYFQSGKSDRKSTESKANTTLFPKGIPITWLAALTWDGP